MGVNMCQAAWVLLSAISSLWLISCLGPVVWAVSSWARATMPVVATILSAVILLQAGSHPAHLLLYAAREMMTAQNPLAIHIVAKRMGMAV